MLGAAASLCTHKIDPDNRQLRPLIATCRGSLRSAIHVGLMHALWLSFKAASLPQCESLLTQRGRLCLQQCSEPCNGWVVGERSPRCIVGATDVWKKDAIGRAAAPRFRRNTAAPSLRASMAFDTKSAASSAWPSQLQT